MGGANTLTVAHSVDGSYLVTINRAAAVTALVVKDQAGGALTLSPSFTAGTLTGYTSTAARTVTSLQVTATFTTGTVTAKTGSGTAQALTSGTGKSDATNLAIVEGAN